jgi:glycine/serine hydroxymethyltransferase
MTTRGCGEAEFSEIAGILHATLQVALEAQEKASGKKLAEFEAALKGEEISRKFEEIRVRVKNFSGSLAYPGL